MMTLFWGIGIYIAFIFLLDLVAEVFAGVFAWAAQHESRIHIARIAN